MSTDEHEEWQARQVLRPADVPMTTPLSWMVSKHSEAGQRLLNNSLPADFPYEVERGTPADALTRLALGEEIVRKIGHYKGSTVHEALELGATWTEVATALDVTTQEARDVLRSYANGQRHLYLSTEAEYPRHPVGFTAARHQAALALIELPDDTPIHRHTATKAHSALPAATRAPAPQPPSPPQRHG